MRSKNRQYTPGPWKSVGTLGPQSTTLRGPRVIEDARGVRIAQVRGPFETDQSVADAQLIAAAPELLDALDTLVMACKLPGDHCEVEQALPAAIAAITKAIGGMA